MRNMGVGDDNACVDRESFAAHKVGHSWFEPVGVWSRYELGVAFGLGRGFCALRRVRFWRPPFAFRDRRICDIARRLHSDDEHVRLLVADQCGFTAISKFVRLTKPRTPTSAGRFPRRTSALILRSEAKPASRSMLQWAPPALLVLKRPSRPLRGASGRGVGWENSILRTSESGH